LASWQAFGLVKEIGAARNRGQTTCGGGGTTRRKSPHPAGHHQLTLRGNWGQIAMIGQGFFTAFGLAPFSEIGIHALLDAAIAGEGDPGGL
jgi:hypothetical protein